MTSSRRRQLILLGPLLAAFCIAPAPGPAPQPPAASPLALERYEAALKQYDETWVYYQQARIDSYQVYVWSRFMLDCRRDMAQNPAERLKALDEHLDRMKRLEALIIKIRRIGFGRSYDVGSARYYRLEAEHWIAQAKASKS